MILHRLEITNWRSFYGTATLEFAVDSAQNTTVIHGDNGSGKTTTLNALLWLFSEKFTSGFSEPDQLVNNRAISEADMQQHVDCSVKCEFDHDGKRHRASRLVLCVRQENIAATHKNSKTDDFNLMVMDESGQWNEAPYPQSFIDGIIPPGIRDFFFFAGEELRDKFEPKEENRKALARQMQHFFGLDLLVHLQFAFEKALRKIAKSVGELDDEGLSKLATRHEQLQSQIDKCDEEHSNQRNKEHLYRDKIESIDKQLNEHREAAELQNNRTRINLELEEIDKSLTSNLRKRRKLVCDKGYFVFLEMAIDRLNSQISALKSSGELPGDVKRPFIQKLLDTNCCICTRPLDTESPERHAVEKILDSTGLTEVEESLLRMSERFSMMQNASDDFWNSLEALKHDNAVNDSKKRALNDELDSISDKLSNSDESNITALESTRNESHDALATANEMQGRWLEKKEAYEEDLRRVLAEIETYRAQNAQAELAQSKHVLAQKSVEYLRTLFEERDDKLRTDLLKLVQERFSELTIRKLTLSLNTSYELKATESLAGEDVNVALSTGELQSLSLAWAGSLIEIQRSQRLTDNPELPLVMDSPWGSLGTDYSRVISSYIDNLADQVIFMVTDSQYRNVESDELKIRTGKSILIVQHVNRKDVGQHIKEIDLGGRRHSLIVETDHEFHWSEIVEVDHVP